MTRLTKLAAAPAMAKWMRATLSASAVRRLATPDGWTKVIIALVAVSAVYVSLLSASGIIGYLAAAFALVMLAIAVIDGHSFVIPDWLNVTAVILAIIHAAALEPDAMLQAIGIAVIRGVILALIFFALRYAYMQFRGRQGLGLGDVKLALVAGAWLDWLMIPVAIEIAAVAALSAYLLRQLLSGRSISATNRMPFGLFFAPAIWICWVLEMRWLPSF